MNPRTFNSLFMVKVDVRKNNARVEYLYKRMTQVVSIINIFQRKHVVVENYLENRRKV